LPPPLFAEAGSSFHATAGCYRFGSYLRSNHCQAGGKPNAVDDYGHSVRALAAGHGERSDLGVVDSPALVACGHQSDFRDHPAWGRGDMTPRDSVGLLGNPRVPSVSLILQWPLDTFRRPSGAK